MNRNEMVETAKPDVQIILSIKEGIEIKFLISIYF